MQGLAEARPTGTAPRMQDENATARGPRRAEARPMGTAPRMQDEKREHCVQQKLIPGGWGLLGSSGGGHLAKLTDNAVLANAWVQFKLQAS